MLGVMRDYHHSHFEGASIAPDGQSLLLDYFDHDQGGTRLCFRYIIPLHASPRLITGYAHEDSRSETEIRFGTIPRHVLSEAQGWLTWNSEAARGKPLAKTLVG